MERIECIEQLESLIKYLKQVETLENLNAEYLRQIRKLEEENVKLKYEYEDSKRKRDKPLPCKWKKGKYGLFMYCPKCKMSISNWQRYCHSCGQKICKGNPLPEMEMLEEMEEE